ncbi:MAG: hypothetical protein ABWX67_09125 [Allosphingosinicella sp.]
MLPVPVYYALFAACGLYVLLRGGAPEKVGTVILAVGSILSVAAVSSPSGRFGAVEVGVLSVDIVTLLAFLVLALRAERYWPLCVTALQAIGTSGHAAKLLDPGVIRSAYAIVLSLWGYLMLLLIAIGTWNHQRRLAKFGVDKSWSSSSGHSARLPPTGPIG